MGVPGGVVARVGDGELVVQNVAVALAEPLSSAEGEAEALSLGDSEGPPVRVSVAETEKVAV
jgi:hypothetical protein